MKINLFTKFLYVCVKGEIIMNSKTTKRDYYMTLLNIIAEVRDTGISDYNFTDLEVFVNNEIDALDKKAESARKRATKRKTEGDEMREVVFNLITSEPQTILDLLPQLRAAMDNDNISAQKLTARLKQLVDLGCVEKSELSVPHPEGGKNRKVMGYSIKNQE